MSFCICSFFLIFLIALVVTAPVPLPDTCNQLDFSEAFEPIKWSNCGQVCYAIATSLADKDIEHSCYRSTQLFHPLPPKQEDIFIIWLALPRKRLTISSSCIAFIELAMVVRHILCTFQIRFYF